MDEALRLKALSARPHAGFRRGLKLKGPERRLTDSDGKMQRGSRGALFLSVIMYRQMMMVEKLCSPRRAGR